MECKQTYAKWITRCFLLLLIMYGCSSEYEERSDENFPVEALTVSGAESWYNEIFGMAPRLKSATEGSTDEALFEPEWNLAELFTDTLWYAVESPMDFYEGGITIMTNEVSNYADENGGKSITKQVLKLIVLRNKETGDTYSFLMAVIPGLDYMLRKGDAIDENKYLLRDSDFDGYVFFYAVNGEFVNGWVYKDGKIIGGTHNLNAEKMTKRYVQMQYSVCWWQYFTFDGVNTVPAYYCETYTENVFMNDNYSDIGNNNGGVNTDDPRVGGGGGGSGSGTTIFKRDPIELSKCSPKATIRGTNANTAMNAASVVNNVNKVRAEATNALQTKETGLRIDYANNSYSSQYYGGTTHEVDIKINSNTVYTIHTHVFGLTAPSPGDVATFLEQYYYYPNYKGAIVFAFNGMEYLLAVDSPAKAREAYEERRGYLETDEKGKFTNSDTKKIYEDALRNLEKKAFNEQNAYFYALNACLDILDTGLVLSVKFSGDSRFREISTNIKTEPVGQGVLKILDYEPQICP